MSPGEWFGAIRAIWPILVVIVAWQIAVIGWRIMVWRSIQSILASGQRIERILLNHKHQPKTGAVVVDAAGVSGTWDNGATLATPPGPR